MKSQQSGFAHAVVIIGLIVLLLGALGFIFWQNFISDKSEADKAKGDTAKQDTVKVSVAETTDDSPAAPDGYIAYENRDEGFSLAYPQEWGSLSPSQTTQPSMNRLGANGDNTMALASLNSGVRIAVYTKDSFFTKSASGYVARYQGNKVIGLDAGSETSEILSPIAGTNVYSDVQGDAGFIAHNLFFEAGNSVVYVTIGDDVAAQLQVAKTVNVD